MNKTVHLFPTILKTFSMIVFSFRFWLVVSGECLHTMTGHRGAVNSVVITSDGGKTISGSSDATIRVWNTKQESRSE